MVCQEYAFWEVTNYLNHCTVVEVIGDLPKCVFLAHHFCSKNCIHERSLEFGLASPPSISTPPPQIREKNQFNQCACINPWEIARQRHADENDNLSKKLQNVKIATVYRELDTGCRGHPRMRTKPCPNQPQSAGPGSNPRLGQARQG